MPKRALTAATIERIKPPPKGQVDHFDKGYPGLALRVSYGGARSWVFFNRWDGKLRRTHLGTFPAMDLGEAREAWREARKNAERGENPNPAKASSKDVLGTVERVAEEFLKRHGPNLRPRTLQELERPIRQLVIKQWGSRAPAQIGRADALSLLDDVAEERGPVAANRTLAVLKTFGAWMVERDIISTSPFASIKRPHKEESRDRVLADDELALLWSIFEELAYPFGPFHKLLALTGQRRDEIAKMKWSELDLESDKPVWTLTKERTKAGREHIVPLSTWAVEILGGHPRPAKPRGDYVFTTTQGKTAISGFSRVKDKIDAKVLEIARDAKGPADWRLHDLRRTAASGIARLGFAPHIVSAVLNHSPGSLQGITAIYNRFRYEDEKRAALNAWGAHIERITENAMQFPAEVAQ